MIKIVSPVYNAGKYNILGEVISFENGKAEVEEAFFEKICKAGVPNIFKEGNLPGVKTKERVQFDETLGDVSKEYMIEIDRLKKIINAKDQQLSESRQETINWKELYKKDTDALKLQLATLKTAKPVVETAESPSTEEKEETLGEDEALRKDLEAMTVVELRDLAEKEGIEADKIKKAALKADLINLIMGV